MNKFERGIEDANIQELSGFFWTLEKFRVHLYAPTDNAETNFHIGDLLVESEYPSVITYRYGGKEKGEVQGYKLGPILIFRARKGCEQGFALWIEPMPEIESEMTADVLEHIIAVRHALSALGLRNNCEIPQSLLDNLDECPSIIRSGTFEDLTRPRGNPLPFGLRLALASYNLIPAIVHNAGLLGREAMNLREKMFARQNPINRRTQNAATAGASQSTGASYTNQSTIPITSTNNSVHHSDRANS